MVVMLRQCCCGCTLKTGTIILGVLNALGGLAILIFGIGATAIVGVGSSEINDLNVVTGAVEALFGAIMLLVAILLIVGAVKAKPLLLVPWIVYDIIFMIAYIIFYTIMAVESFKSRQIPEAAGSIVSIIITIVLETYFILVVYSLYRELKGTAPTSSA